MPGHPTPATARLGGVTSRRHAELLLRSGVDGVSVKDLRLRRVVPPAAGSLNTSPECVAPVKPGSVESTPPEAASAVAAAEDLDRKLVPPRPKLVHDPRSFGYRRLLPFLNEMTKNGNVLSDSPLSLRYIGKEALPQNTAADSKDDLSGSNFRLADESMGDSHCEPEALDSVEPVVVSAGRDTDVKDGGNNVTEEINTVPHDITNKPLLARCTRSRFVHHPSSFSYKRMLPFLMENEISAQGSDRAKIRKVAEERQLASNENDASASGQQCLVVSDDSSLEYSRAQTEIMEEENLPKSDETHVLDDRQLQPAVSEASPPDCSVVEVQNVMQQEALASSQGPVTFEAEVTSDVDDVQDVGQHQLVASEESPEERTRDEDIRSIHDEAENSDGGYDLDSREFQSAVSEVSPSENSAAEVHVAAQKPLPLDEVGENSDNNHVSKGQPKLYVTKESLTAQLQDNTKFAVPQCQDLDSGCHVVGFGSPTKKVIPLLHRHCAQEPQDSVVSLDDQLIDNGMQMISRPSDPCASDRSLSEEEMSGCFPFTESRPRGAHSMEMSASSKAGIPRPRGAHSMEKRALSPKKLSPKKGILKRNTRGCKGICMCLDCCTFRLHADRAFEFSRKQMQEADDIISNLLKEVAGLRSLLEKPAGQVESPQAACRRASRAEEVARNRCQQMFLDLNSHCRIPGPRVRFTEYVEEKKASSSPRSSNRR